MMKLEVNWVTKHWGRKLSKLLPAEQFMVSCWSHIHEIYITKYIENFTLLDSIQISSKCVAELFLTLSVCSSAKHCVFPSTCAKCLQTCSDVSRTVIDYENIELHNNWFDKIFRECLLLLRSRTIYILCTM